MRMQFFVAAKDRNWELAEAVQAGARVHGDEVVIADQREVVTLPEGFDAGACLGVKRAAKRLLAAHVEAGRHFALFDKGYMRRESFVRVSIDAWQPLAYFQRARPSDRFDRLGIRLQPRKRGRHIVFAGSSQKYANFHGLGDATAYAEGVIATVRERTDRPIVYRPKPSWAANHADECAPIEGTIYAGPEKPLAHWLEGAHALVTHGSNAALDALAAGVPVIVLGESIARPMSASMEQIEEPYFPGDAERLQFFSDAAYAQWTLEELRSGEAWADLRTVMETF